MKKGKLPNSLLKDIILDPINMNSAKRDEVLLTPAVGEDCAVIDFGKSLCLASSDPITGAVNEIGKLAVNINANDIAAGGGEPIGIFITALFPVTVTEEDIKKITEDISRESAKANVAVLGGHTEITDAVVKPILSCTVLGKTKRMISSRGAMAGDKAVITKYAGIEGTSIFAHDKEAYLKDKLTNEELNEAKSLSEQLSVVKEGKIATEFGVNAMHDITEGGVLGACWEVAECSGTGIRVDTESIPVLPVTKKICSLLGVNPLRLISSGSMLIAVKDGEGLVNRLKEEGINATVIGTFTENKEMYTVTEGKESIMEAPEADELYKV